MIRGGNDRGRLSTLAELDNFLSLSDGQGIGVSMSYCVTIIGLIRAAEISPFDDISTRRVLRKYLLLIAG